MASSQIQSLRGLRLVVLGDILYLVDATRPFTTAYHLLASTVLFFGVRCGAEA